MPWLSLELKNAKFVRQGLEKLRRNIPLVGRKRIYDALVEIRRIMKEPGDPVTYPIKWDSTKQRKAFFASNGFGKGIPTVRTGKYQRAWTIHKVGNVGYDLGNPLAHAKYIGGTLRSERRQSKIHRGRWNVLRFAVMGVLGKVPKKVYEVLKLTARQAGFRTKD